MHLKRTQTSKKWPIPRKGTKFVVRPRREIAKGVPLLIILRDMLRLGQNRKEIKQILNKGEIEVNGKIRRDDKFQVLLFDIIKIKSIDKVYTLIITKAKKFSIVGAREEKISKVIGKKILKGNLMQINLIDGANLLMKEKINVGDSVLLDSKRKIIRIIYLKEGASIIVINGKHIGEEGKIEKIEEKSAHVLINSNKVNINLENLMAVQ